MNVVMLTNTYLPHVGGVARSVASFASQLRKRGHTVTIVAPEFPDTPEHEEDVVRVPAVQNFNGSDFSVQVRVPWLLSSRLEQVEVDVVHSHHPFLLGDSAYRLAVARDAPLVFTHHTMYERYTHYVPGDSPALQKFAIELATLYANLCDHVVAPSESIAAVLAERGVTTPLTAIPTGVPLEEFSQGRGDRARRAFGIPAGAFLVGHVGRLAPEKNLEFLAQAVARFLARNPAAWFLVVGAGPSARTVEEVVAGADAGERLVLAGQRTGQELVDAYHAMDAFAFASLTETQGMVLAEAMAAGTPVVALDAPGARELVDQGRNGQLLESEDPRSFADALEQIAQGSREERSRLAEAARQRAAQVSEERCTERLEGVYEALAGAGEPSPRTPRDAWDRVRARIRAEWSLLTAKAEAMGDILGTEREGNGG